MLELLILMLIATTSLIVLFREHPDENDISGRVGNRMARLWDVAQQSMKNDKFLRAEKALLTILKIDQKNAAAYNRLGILYAKQKEFDDAIDCFEIATTIDRTASSLHNLGLIYFETERYDKAGVAFKQAIELDNELAARYIAYAKVLERQDKVKEVVAVLEKAVELEPSIETYSLLRKAYVANNQDGEAENLTKKINSISTQTQTPVSVKRSKKAVV